MSKMRNSTNRIATMYKDFAPKNVSSGGHALCRKNSLTTHGMKQIGTAQTSSSTIEPGSRCLRIASALPQIQTDAIAPPIMPPTNPQMFWVDRRMANHSTPNREPKVPGAQGTRPTPNPCASHRIRPSILHVGKVNLAVAPEINGARDESERDGEPQR